MIKNKLNKIEIIFFIGTNENIVKINNHKCIQFFNKDFIDIIFETS